jgi:putative flippase GtrA
MLKHKNTIYRFIKFSTSSSSTTLIDLLILGFLTSYLGINYLFSSGFAFFISNTINFAVNINWGFKDSKRGVKSSYTIFIIVGFIGLALTVFLMWIFVSILNFHYLLARVVVAIIEGTLSFVVHNIYTFKTAETVPIFGFKTKE